MTATTRRRVSPGVTRPYLTIKEAAEYLGVGVDTVYEACASRGLKHVKLGHSTIRLRLDWIDAWTETLARQVS